MFQYAFGKSLAIKNDASLILDNWSGFIRDFDYKRKYSLNQFNIENKFATHFQKLPFWILRKKFVFLGDFQKKFINILSGDILIEDKLSYSELSHNVSFSKNISVLGYWQSPLYFNNIKDYIYTNLNPPNPTEMKYRLIGNEITNSNSLAICLRFYEESRNPLSHSKDGINFDINDIFDKIRWFKKKYQNINLFFFSTINFDLPEDINKDFTFRMITSENGFTDELSVLWLISKCNFHIITNSTFYWWGAWFKYIKSGPEKTLIFASKNFINTDTIPNHWIPF